MVADTYSRKLWTRPLLKKTGEQVLTAMKSIESDMKPIIIESIICDKGTEFGNNQFKTHFGRQPRDDPTQSGVPPNNAKIFSKNPEIFNSSLAIVDRLCRTFRDILN